MSRCHCENSTEFRITGEVNNEASEDAEVRVRCEECGGKVTYIPGAWLADLPGLELDDVRAGRVLSEDEQKTITVDLI